MLDIYKEALVYWIDFVVDPFHSPVPLVELLDTHHFDAFLHKNLIEEMLY